MPKEPEPVNDQCDALAPGVIPATTYTLFYVEHVIYLVSVNNGAPVDVILTQDTTYDVVPRDARIHVTARVDDPTKYEMKPWAWEMVFFDFGDCKPKLTPLTPLATDQFCEEDGPLAPRARSPSRLPTKVQKQGTITIPATPVGIQYFLDGAPVAAGVYTVAPGLHEVTATVLDGATTKLDPAIVLPFKFDIKPGLCEPDLLVVPGGGLQPDRLLQLRFVHAVEQPERPERDHLDRQRHPGRAGQVHGVELRHGDHRRGSQRAATTVSRRDRRRPGRSTSRNRRCVTSRRSPSPVSPPRGS